MAEDFNLSSLVLPGTYIRVRAEGLISVGGISTGNVAIVGTAAESTEAAVNAERFGKTHIPADYRDALAIFGRYDAFSNGSGQHNLTRALELLYANGASTVYARAVKPGVTDFKADFEELLKEDVNILIAPELAADDATGLLKPLLESAENNNRDVMAVVGSEETEIANIKADVQVDDRLIVTAPGIQTKETLIDSQTERPKTTDVTLTGNYTAACIAGLLATLTPQTSPTNKVLPGVVKISQRFNYNQLKDLTSNGVMVLEDRSGIRVVRGVGTEMKDGGPFKQVTTRRITDFAKAGVRRVGNPFIGKLNNERVRKALQGALQGFLDTMVADEALTGYDLRVFATRDDEIAGRAMVDLTLRPTFSIDFVTATIVLE